MSGRQLRNADVLRLYAQTAGGDPDGPFPWGFGPATEEDVAAAIIKANEAGNLKRPFEPWSKAEAEIIRDYVVGIVRARAPLYRITAVVELDGDGRIIQDGSHLALVYDEDGVADNWGEISAKFHRYGKGLGKNVARLEGLGQTTVSRMAARLSVDKRTLQRRRKEMRRTGVDPDTR